MSDHVKHVLNLISYRGTRWPYLRYDEYLASGEDYTTLDFKGIPSQPTVGYELHDEELQYGTPQAREWFCYELRPLVSPSNADCPEFIREQLDRTIETIEIQVRKQKNMDTELWHMPEHPMGGLFAGNPCFYSVPLQ